MTGHGSWPVQQKRGRGGGGVVIMGNSGAVSGCAVWRSDCSVEQVIRFGAPRRGLGRSDELGWLRTWLKGPGRA